MSATTRSRLPDGFEVRLRDDVLRAEGGRVLVGGSPTRVARLSDRARALLQGARLVVDGPTSAALARRLLDGNLADPVVDGIEVSADDLTVVVPARDRVEQLGRCLAALAPLRVLVVDDASEDSATVARVAKQYGAGVVPLAHNVGPAGARNVGLALVCTPLVAFVDSDVVVDGPTLLDLARHCADSQVALVAPRVVGNPQRSRPRWFERYDAAASSLDLGRIACQVRPGGAVAWLPSACLVGRAELLGDGFDPELRVGEDVDLVWRLHAASLTVRYDPSAVARHDVRSTVRAWLGRKFVYGTGGAALARRHGANLAPASLSLTMAVGAAAVLQRRWWSAPVAAAAVAWSTWGLRTRLPLGRGRTVLAAWLSARGLGWAVRQEAGLVLRHWWPLAAVGAVGSRSVRRILVSAVAVDLVMFLRERPGVDLPTVLLARRLDDLAYGAGLWWGAIGQRSARCLAVRRPRATRRGLFRVASSDT
ncbi:mycofactocin system glycosyltransferase [Nocardioides immobilis]|uniref:Mycofactocin system glycosyltransferase n=1 Tax=Nocardioides immobilis TaxID=2049295 RepID=A0A417XU35_9ACTN|nr:mycofactocin biosynthesis glycosyltransferase MftF [Nocardioides immobilis]RHW23815.1 mycofactocin system glycosyltransferase [Nocardioides immobilis]